MDGKQLKNSILQWAIQGKLVPQNPKDEPAQKLLERIAASRNDDVSPWSEAIGPSKNSKKSLSTSLRGPCKATKQSKNQPSRIYRENGVWYEQVGTATPKDISDEIPFEIPENWAWCRLAQLAEIQSSKRVFEKDYVTTGIPFFRSKEIGELSRGESIHTELYITKQHYKELKEKYGVPQVGDILLTSVGSIGNLWICDGREFYYKDGNVTQICSNSSFDSQYVALYLSSPLFFEQIRSSVAGTAYNALTIIKLKSLILPLPPLAEQKRIVAKLEQVLPLAEEYGVAQEQLDKLNKELPEALKKSILQEAIQGKLVEQNPKDEPAQKLLERIAASRNESSLSLPKGTSSTSLRGAKATKQSKNPPSRIYRENGVWYEQIGNAEPKDITDEIPFDIPTSWVWCRLKRVCCDFIVPQRDKPTKFNGCIPWCRIEDIEGKFLNGSKSNQLVTKELADSMNMHLCPKGTVICACSASIGNQAITTVDCYTNQTFIGVVCEKEALYNEYLYYFMMSQKQNLKDLAKGTTIGYISRKKFEEYIFPLPPLAEQKRIVTKLEQLFKVL